VTRCPQKAIGGSTPTTVTLDVALPPIAFHQSDGHRSHFATILPIHPEAKAAFDAMRLPRRAAAWTSCGACATAWHPGMRSRVRRTLPMSPRRPRPLSPASPARRRGRNSRLRPWAWALPAQGQTRGRESNADLSIAESRSPRHCLRGAAAPPHQGTGGQPGLPLEAGERILHADAPWPHHCFRRP
jgi:hypothetical protein